MMDGQYNKISIKDINTLTESTNQTKASLDTLTTNFNNHNHDSLYCKAITTGKTYTIS